MPAGQFNGQLLQLLRALPSGSIVHFRTCFHRYFTDKYLLYLPRSRILAHLYHITDTMQLKLVHWPWVSSYVWYSVTGQNSQIQYFNSLKVDSLLHLSDNHGTCKIGEGVEHVSK